MKRNWKIISIVLIVLVAYFGVGLALCQFSPWPMLPEVHQAAREEFTFTKLGWCFLPCIVLYETLFSHCIPRPPRPLSNSPCIDRLLRLAQAKYLYAQKFDLTNGTPVVMEDLKTFYSLSEKHFPPVCYEGTYSINPIGTLPTCSMFNPNVHRISESAVQDPTDLTDPARTVIIDAPIDGTLIESANFVSGRSMTITGHFLDGETRVIIKVIPLNTIPGTERDYAGAVFTGAKFVLNDVLLLPGTNQIIARTATGASLTHSVDFVITAPTLRFTLASTATATFQLRVENLLGDSFETAGTFPGPDIEILIKDAEAGIYAMSGLYVAGNGSAPVTLQGFYTEAGGGPLDEQLIVTDSFSLVDPGDVLDVEAIVIHSGRETGGYQVRGHKLEAQAPSNWQGNHSLQP